MFIVENKSKEPNKQEMKEKTGHRTNGCRIVGKNSFVVKHNDDDGHRSD